MKKKKQKKKNRRKIILGVGAGLGTAAIIGGILYKGKKDIDKIRKDGDDYVKRSEEYRKKLQDDTDEYVRKSQENRKRTNEKLDKLEKGLKDIYSDPTTNESNERERIKKLNDSINNARNTGVPENEILKNTKDVDDFMTK